jgi:hypothetical protein
LEEQKKEDQKKQYFKQFFDFIGDLPFWIDDKKEHYEIYKNEYDRYQIPFCCLNHFIGLPYKKDDNGVMQPHPMYPYEQILYRALLEKNYKYLWVNKAAGLGLTEFFLRLILFFCVNKNLRNRFANSQICIVVGPRLKLGIDIMKRFKSLFLHLETSSKVPFIRPFMMEGSAIEVVLNDVTITAYPSNHMDTMRGQPNVSFSFVDEGDFFPPREQANVLTIPTRYVGKSQTWIAMISTPQKIGGLFHTIENDPTSPFKRFIFSYEWGMKKYGANLFTPQMIAEAQKHRFQDFEREYNNKYEGFGGNLFSLEFLYQLQQKSNYYQVIPKDIGLFSSAQFEIDESLPEEQLEKQYDEYSDYKHYEDFSNILQKLHVFEEFALKNPYNKYFRLAGVDTGYGSSFSGVTLGQINLETNKLEIFYENQFKNMSPKLLAQFLNYLIKVLKIRKIGIDRSDLGFVIDFRNDIELAAFKHLNFRKMKPEELRTYIYDSDMLVCPITFSEDTKREMLYHQVVLFDDDFIRIHPLMNLTHANLSSLDVHGQMSYEKEKLPAPDQWDSFSCLTELVKIEE